jgi:ABC-2 type transport system permease protein
VLREWLRFVLQRTRFLSALVRPLLWLLVFAAGFRAALGIAIIEPYDTYIPYEVYIIPGLACMILLFNGMQGSLSMVYDREMGSMRVLLTSPLPRTFLLCSKLLATSLISLLQVYAFLAIAWLYGVRPPAMGLLLALPALLLVALMLSALGLLLSPAGELCRGDEFRDLPAVFPVIGAVSAVEDARGQRMVVLAVRGESVHPCGGAGAFCPV